MSDVAVTYRRPFHRLVQQLLVNLDAELLGTNACYFGGGTRAVLELAEYRESKDVDFLCADRDGYRVIREIVAEHGLHRLLRHPMPVRREARMDMDGIRAVIDVDGEPIKFEIILEARLPRLLRDDATCNGVAQLAKESAFAEKFLANADRALDASTLSRDVIDLAHMAVHWDKTAARNGLIAAESAYGADVRRKLDLAIAKLQTDKPWRQRCERGLGIESPKVLRAGLEKLQATQWRKPPIASRRIG